ncbi:Sensor protein ZraS [Hydrogenovibrio crunogenus]|uniref:histidine kinase n=2 Tax=Hydrogenovibrio crunogenus TaxID=39765 RepID=A0A4V1C8R1_9GAMM|nr:Sensor protein ZraS [Hydrogenovibrio crunogenus]
MPSNTPLVNMPILDNMDGQPFNEQDWMSVLQAVEDSYSQSLEYQTQVEQQNDELQKAHQFISDIISAMSDVLIVTNKELMITQVNDSFLTMTGYDEQDVIGKPVRDFLTSKDVPEMEPILASEQIHDKLMTLKGRNQELSITINCNCQIDKAKAFDGRVIVGRPIGEILEAYDALKKAHEELALTKEKMIHSEKMAALGRLVSGVAHELNTPISVIQGNLWSLQQYFQDVESIVHQNQSVQNQLDTTERETFNEIINDCPAIFEDNNKALDQISSIVKDLKSFSHPNGEKQVLFSINDSVNTAIKWVERDTANQHNIKIEFQPSQDIDYLAMGSTNQFQQVIINLLQNAVDELQNLNIKDKQINVKVTESDSGISVQVRDNGNGIPEGMLPNIFDPFFTTKDVGKGTGLGLSMSHQIIENMHGSLTAWNKVEGGAVFEIKLQKSAPTL